MEKKRDSREVTMAARSQVRPEYAAMYGIPDYYELSGAEISRKVKPMVETAAAHIGVEEQAYGPPGCSRPRMNLNSGGNERFYSYDGQWKGGRLGGFGKCVACALRNHCCCSACPERNATRPPPLLLPTTPTTTTTTTHHPPPPLP